MISGGYLPSPEAVREISSAFMDTGVNDNMIMIVLLYTTRVEKNSAIKSTFAVTTY